MNDKQDGRPEITKAQYDLLKLNGNEDAFLKRSFKLVGLDLPKPSVTEDYLAQLITFSKAMLEIKDKVRKIAPIDDPVLILGETGTGKELIAKASLPFTLCAIK